MMGMVKCPNCGREFRRTDVASKTGSPETVSSIDDETGLIKVTQSEPSFSCPNCPAVIKTSVHFKNLANLRDVALGWAAASGFFSAFLSITSNGPGTRLFAAVLLILMGGSSISVSVIAQVLLRCVNRWEVAWMRFKCTRCGTLIGLEDSGFCPNCGASVKGSSSEKTAVTKQKVEEAKVRRSAPKDKPIGTCLVCDLELNSTDAVTQCPHCRNAFHKTHLIEWVRKRKSCPACQAPLDEKELWQ